MAYRTAVIGASGYTGAELLRLAAGHSELEIVHVTADSNAGASVAALYPSLAAAYPSLEYSTFDTADVAGLDVAFLGLPHGESQRVVPELLDRFAFGLPELFRADIAAAEHVAVPGCYPTAAALALAPLLAGGFVEPDGVVVDAMSGVSGRGRGLSAPSLYSEANESVAAYGLLTHRHTGEIEMALSRVAGAPVSVLFTPHLVPMTRGLLATCHARPAVDGLTSEQLLGAYRDFYEGEPFVVVSDEPPPTKAALAANTAYVTVRFDERTGSVLALGALDNLVKGASGQALQCANLLLGLPEPTGLSTVGVMP